MSAIITIAFGFGLLLALGGSLGMVLEPSSEFPPRVLGIGAVLMAGAGLIILGAS